MSRYSNSAGPPDICERCSREFRSLFDHALCPECRHADPFTCYLRRWPQLCEQAQRHDDEGTAT